MTNIRAHEGSVTCEPVTGEVYLNRAKLARAMEETEFTQQVPAPPGSVREVREIDHSIRI